MLPTALPNLGGEAATASWSRNFEASIINSYCIVSLLFTYIICNLKTLVVNDFILILKWKGSIRLLCRVRVWLFRFRVFRGNSYNFFCLCHNRTWLGSVTSESWATPTFFLNASSYLNLLKPITSAFLACDSTDGAGSLACTVISTRLHRRWASVTTTFVDTTTLGNIVGKLSIAASLFFQSWLGLNVLPNIASS